MAFTAENTSLAAIGDFDKRSGSLVERLIFNNRWLVVVFCMIATGMLALSAMDLRFNASFERMIPANHPFIKNYSQYKSELSGLGNTLKIAVESRSGTIFDPEYLETLRRINDEVFLTPGVDQAYMKSLWTPATRWTGVTEEGLVGGPVISDEYDGSQDSIETIRGNIERSGEIGQLVAPDFGSSVIVVPLLDKVGGKSIDYKALSDALEEIRSRHEGEGARIYITGFAKVAGDLIAGVVEVLKYFAIAIVLCTAVLYWYTRCVRSTLIVVACSIVAVVWQLGTLPVLGIELDPYSVLVPFLIFAIGMSHGAQKMNGIMQDIGRGMNRLVAARFTFRRLFLAGLTALLADAVGFAVLMVIDIGVIKDLAVAASIGVAGLIFTNLILIPVLLSYVGVSEVAARRSLHDEIQPDALSRRKHLVWDLLDRFTHRKWAGITVFLALILGGTCAAVSTNLKIGDTEPGAPELRPESRYNRDSAFMVSRYGASSDVYVVMVRTPENQCAAFDVLSRLDELGWRLQQLPGVSSTISAADISKRASVGLAEGTLKWFDLPRSQDSLNSIMAQTPRDYFNQECSLLALYVYLKDHRAETLDSVVAAVSEFAMANDTNDVQFLSAAGNAGIEAATNIVVKQANVEMLILVYAAVVVLAFIAFRSWRAVACAVIPLMLTSVMCEALMVALGIGVKVSTLPVIALGVGIGIDYALYILAVMLSQLRSGASLSDAYYRALVFTGRVVMLTGITLGVAVGTWAFSMIKFQADMGILLSFMFVFNMIGALVLLPSLGAFLLGKTAAGQPAFKLAH